MKEGGAYVHIISYDNVYCISYYLWKFILIGIKGILGNCKNCFQLTCPSASTNWNGHVRLCLAFITGIINLGAIAYIWTCTLVRRGKVALESPVLPIEMYIWLLTHKGKRRAQELFDLVQSGEMDVYSVQKLIQKETIKGHI